MFLDHASRLTSNHLVTIFLVMAAMIAGVIVSALSIWGKVRRAQIAANLKLDMLERGMSAEEIRAVVDAGAER
jgi:hypothetical protein